MDNTLKINDKKAAQRLSNALDDDRKTDPSSSKHVTDKSELSKIVRKYSK